MSEIEKTRELPAHEVDAVTGGTKSDYLVRLALLLGALADQQEAAPTGMSGALGGAAKGAT